MPMTNEELVKRIKAGELTLYEQLYNQNRGIIYKACRQYGKPADYEDLLQECFFALQDAVRLYEEESGKFVGYLWFWLKQCIIKYRQNCGNAIRVPAEQVNTLRKCRAAAAKYRSEFGRDPEPAELAVLAGISPEALDHLKDAAAALQVLSLNAPFSVDGEHDTELEAFVQDDHDGYDDVLERIQREELAAALWSTVDALDGKQAECIRMRYREDMGLREIGEKNGISVTAVKQRIDAGLRKLRSPEYTKRLVPFLDGYAYNRAVKGVGIRVFQRSGTSATERAALKLMELEDRLNYGFSEL